MRTRPQNASWDVGLGVREGRAGPWVAVADLRGPEFPPERATPYENAIVSVDEIADPRIEWSLDSVNKIQYETF